MTRTATLKAIRKARLIPVIRTPDNSLAKQAIEVLASAGVSIFELTLTTPGAVELIRDLARDTGLLVGAGTVLNIDQARQCVFAGAKFIVSPILDRETVAFCSRANTGIFPAGLTPNEIYTARRAGADAVKVFPCGSMGGASYIRSLKSVFPEIELIPTGGVSAETAGDYLKAGAFAVGAGTDLVDVEALKNGNVEAVRRRAEEYMAAVA